MSAPELQVVYRTDEEYTGQIRATVKSGPFSAAGAAWFDRINVKETFLVALRKFPLPENDPPTLEGGFWQSGNPKRLDQCHLRISIRPYDRRGTLLVHVDVSSEVWKTPDADLQNSASLRFRAEYPAVEAFTREFEEVLDGKREIAILTGIVA
ncbi:hypothetical protein I6F30_16680 [Bradyrhizobium sp. NBAIM20]|uniref:DUF1857 family protein n=1 Tax=Bradyrhizobium yuanmingense TaxID=108015 RepID=A0ABV4GTP8_9BRAD|nr:MULTISPECIES: hypothetical protein [Bradyrhizobium]MCA1412758.1 hypothetical protein [Bradyrhizobium sp. NBAIM20]MCA1461160.1 hypothetical protein [Bradyrhizobium sp. NBAIM18]